MNTVGKTLSRPFSPRSMKIRPFIGLFLCVATIASAAEPGPFELHAVVTTASDHTKEYSEPTHGNESAKVLLDTTVLLDQTSVKSASLEPREADGVPRILIKLTDEGRKVFGDISTKYLDKRIGIVLNGELQSAPVIKSPMFGGSLQITGNFTEAEAVQLVQKINQSISR